MMTERRLCASSELGDGGIGLRFLLATDPKLGAGDTANAFAIRFQGKVYAYRNQCAHVPVELDWQHGEFFDYSGLYLTCATHGALYAPESGRCMGGRCNGKHLKPIEVIERDGSVFVIEEGGERG